MTQERTFKRYNSRALTTALGHSLLPAHLLLTDPHVTLMLSLDLEAEVMLALELSCSGEGSLLLGKTSKSTAQLCRLLSRACSKAIHNIHPRFLQEDHSRDGTELSECF